MNLKYKDVELKPVNLYCISPDGESILQAYESPLRYHLNGPHGCYDLCCLCNLGCVMGNPSIRNVCSDFCIIWRKLE